MSDDKNDNLKGELLSSGRISNFMALAYGLPGNIPDSPSWIWEQIRINPYLAMAVFEDIEEKDAVVSSALDARKDNVLAKSRRVLPASEKRQDMKLAAMIEETLEGYFDVGEGIRLGFDNVLYEALDAIGKGVAIGETIYDEAADRVFIKDIKFKPQHLFSFGEGLFGASSQSTYLSPQTGPLRLRPGIFGEGISSETLLPPKKFFVFSYRPKHGNRWGTPLLRKVFWQSWFKRADVKQWLKYLEKGSGSVVARYTDGAAPEEQQRALDAARAINEESAAAIPKKFMLEVLQHVRQSMGSSFSELAGFCNKEITLVIKGQTLTSQGSDGGGSRALGEVHERVEDRKTEVDCKGLMLAVNTQIVWPLVVLNQGMVAQPPVWTIDYEGGEDKEQFSRWLHRLWQMRVPISKSHVYNTFQLPQPKDDDDVLEMPTGHEDLRDPDDGGGGSFAEQEKKDPRPARRLPGGSSERWKPQPKSKTERFERLRPSTMKR
jgi:phage gp29-like protein